MQEYITTDRHIHWLSQVIAKVNKALVPAQEDDSHTNLYLDPIGQRLTGRWIASAQGNIMLALDLNHRRFEWLNARLQSQAVIDIFNKELKDLELEVASYPQSLGINVEGIAAPLHFEIPDYHIHSIQPEALTQEGLNKWMNIRDLANNACMAVTGYLQVNSEIRIWPHHFDTGIYSQVNESLGIGFGLAMEDSMLGEPYFYLAGYRSNPPILYTGLPTLGSGKWITGEHWNGAVLPLSEIFDLPSGHAMENIKSFIRPSADWFLNV